MSTSRQNVAGFTLLELIIAMALTLVVLVKAGFVIREATSVAQRDSGAMLVEDQARLVLDRIAYAIMGADREALVPENTVFPLHTNDLSYRVSVGLEEGQVVWTDPELIALDGNGTQVVWKQNPDETDEIQVVWTNLVRDLLEGEVVNGEDDNGNGLVDEEGLSFVIDENHITVRLSLFRPGDERDSFVSHTVETTVTCRNGIVER